MSAASTDTPKPIPPDLSGHFERIVTDRHLKAGRELVQAMALPRAISVLELGCGTGLFSEQLAAYVGMQGEVLGLDPSAYHIAIAHQRARPHLRFQVGSPDTLARFPSGCFDAVIANGLLHTWPDPRAPLAAVLRLLKPGGTLGLATHSAAHPHPVHVAQREVLAKPPYASHPQPPHAQDHAVDADTLHALLQAAGFEHVKVLSQPDECVHATVDAAIEFAQACTWGQLLRHLPEPPDPLRTLARADIAARLQAQRTSQGIHHRGVRLIAVARCPFGAGGLAA